ncbi:type II secretion system protein GspL [Halioxenophilus aromaticivorans]|uniref:Type II secretion system protein L n=1 Tax=Halioxenophilus aromaticivorans TaxID=1306992 RepID=A0AAV3U5X0_9ALTE
MNRLVVIYDSHIPGQNPSEPGLTWRLMEDGNWMGQAEAGTLESLKEAQEASHAEVWLAVASDEIVMQQAHFDASQRRHLAKLMPYELEELIIGNVDDFHFAYGSLHADKVAVAYTPMDWLSALLEQFDLADIEVAVCTPLPLLLPWAEGTWSLRWLGGEAPVEVRYAHDLAFTVPLAILADSLLSLVGSSEEDDIPDQIKLLGQNFEDLQTLQEQLPERLQERATSAQWDQWLSLSLDLLPALNLRQQELSRTLPIARWWQTWKPAAIVAGVALGIYLVSNWVTLAQLKGEQREYLAASEQAYRSVVPQGSLVEPERQLASQLSRYKSSSSDDSDGAVALLATVGPVLNINKDLTIRNLHYVDGDMRLNIESPDFQQIDQLRSTLENQRLQAELLGTSSVDDGVQARLRIRSAP